MDATERLGLIEQYRAGHQTVVDALEGITEGELDAQPGGGQWSPRQIAHHLADSELTSAIRLRRLLAEQRPLLAGYDEEEFARRLHYDRPIESSLEALRAARLSSASLLERLTEQEWIREGTARAAATPWRTGCASTPPMLTTTPRRSAAPARAHKETNDDH